MEAERLNHAARWLMAGLALQPLAMGLDVVWLVAATDQAEDLAAWGEANDFGAGVVVIVLLALFAGGARAIMYRRVAAAIAPEDEGLALRAKLASFLPALRYLVDLSLLRRAFTAVGMEREPRALTVLAVTKVLAIAMLVGIGLAEGFDPTLALDGLAQGALVVWLVFGRAAVLVTMASALKQAQPIDVPAMRASHDEPVGFRASER
jgi:hypothetical protein